MFIVIFGTIDEDSYCSLNAHPRKYFGPCENQSDAEELAEELFQVMLSSSWFEWYFEQRNNLGLENLNWRNEDLPVDFPFYCQVQEVSQPTQENLKDWL